jgi:hypothetical protein
VGAIKTYPMQHSTILRLYSEKEVINTSPDYQRKGDVWTLEKKQLLLDSVLNEYDIPKLYLHLLSPEQRKEDGAQYDYAIIDGRQRLETIWAFIDGSVKLATDFEYFADKNVQASGLTYSDLGSGYPKLKIRFDSFILPIIIVETEDLDLIEDMFSRLNEAVPLNAAEKRNAIGGAMADVIRRVANHCFFKRHVKFADSRYQHREVAAKLLYLEYSLDTHSKITDTKKPYLDEMVRIYKDDSSRDAKLLESLTVEVLDAMSRIFEENDYLLRTQSPVTVYYLLVKEAMRSDALGRVTRSKLSDFIDKIQSNRQQAEQDITKANFDYLEYDRMSQQGTNDAASIKERLRILREYLEIGGSFVIPGT